MPPVYRSSSPVQLRAEGFITSLRESRLIVKDLKIQKKKLDEDRKLYQKILSEQKEELNEARMENFFLKFNPNNLRNLMAEVNMDIVRCQCMACYECGRTDDAPFCQSEALTCRFAPKWEAILESYQISFAHHLLPEHHDEEKFMRDITDRTMGARLMIDADIVNIGHDDLWRNVAYGRGLARKDSRPFTKSRNKLRFLFDFIKDYRPQEVEPTNNEPEIENSAETDAGEEQHSPLINLAGPGQRPPGTGPVMMGRP